MALIPIVIPVVLTLIVVVLAVLSFTPAVPITVPFLGVMFVVTFFSWLVYFGGVAIENLVTEMLSNPIYIIPLGLVVILVFAKVFGRRQPRQVVMYR